MRDIKRFLRPALLVALATLPLVASHSAARAAMARTGTFHPKVTVAKPRALFRVDGARPLATLRYTIVDRGAPSETRFVLDSNAIVFNNTGQIAGIAYDSVAQRYVCELYDGKRYRDLSAATSITGCSVDAIGDASPGGGTVDVVGYADTVYAPGDSKAFYAGVPLGSGGIKATIYPNDDARLIGINAAGTAVGFSDYYPTAGFATQQPPFLAKPGQGSLALLQPGCTLLGPGCGEYDPSDYHDEVSGVCPFGGCQITADGSILLSDLYTGSYEIVAPDGSSRDIVLPADLNSFPTINNAKQLVYSIVTIVAGVTQVRTQIDTLATGGVTTIPALPGNSCRQYTPLSMNDAGHVLGYTSDCPLSDDTYFTYDATHGTQDLVAAIPTGAFSVSPQAIDDKDEILIGLAFETPTTYVGHWALLEPTAASATRALVSTSHWAMSAQARVSTARPQRTIVARAGKPQPRVRVAARFTPRPVRLRARAATSAAPQYSVIDYGAPAVSNYTLEMPVAFNNTGQIVGIARDLPYVNSSSCILFDGARFRNISASPTITNCTPRSIADESSAGRLVVVGTALATYSNPYSEDGDHKAFESTIEPSTGFVGTTLFGGNDMSDLTAINASGLAVGVGAYSVAGTGGEPLFFLAPGTLSLDERRAPCATGGGNCGYLLELGCAFGGCNVTADGSLYLYGEVVDPNGSLQPVGFDGDTYGSIINNAKQILYTADIVHRTSPDTAATRIYQVGTGAVTMVPPIPGSTCRSYAPISFNNVGAVLGFTGDCSLASDVTFYVYDPVNGTRDLLAELPPGNAAIEPIGINDKGEIAFGLALPSGITHWGMLEPSAPANVRRAGVIVRPRAH